MVETVELQNLCVWMTIHSVWTRKELKGTHENNLDRNDEDWMKHTSLVYFDKDEGTTEIKKLDEDECEVVDLVARVY